MVKHKRKLHTYTCPSCLEEKAMVFKELVGFVEVYECMYCGKQARIYVKKGDILKTKKR